jgi:YesN/AraC family two-component response regulator
MYKLVIIDDDIGIANNLSNYFPWEENGYKIVEKFYDGRSAYQYLLHNTVDIILCDIKMPVMNGIEFAERMYRTRRKEIIIFISGYKDFDYARKAMEYGVKYYLLKPVTYKEIKDKLCEITGILNQRNNAHREYDVENIQMKRIERIKDYINQNYDSVSLASIAAYVNMNMSYLSRFFEQHTGEHLSDYMLRVRMKAAVELLGDEQNKNIYEIGKKVGYYSADRFTQAFRRHFGVTPNEYRKNFSKIN